LNTVKPISIHILSPATFVAQEFLPDEIKNLKLYDLWGINAERMIGGGI